MLCNGRFSNIESGIIIVMVKPEIFHWKPVRILVSGQGVNFRMCFQSAIGYKHGWNYKELEIMSCMQLGTIWHKEVQPSYSPSALLGAPQALYVAANQSQTSFLLPHLHSTELTLYSCILVMQ